MTELTGKTALITGASRGIGAACAHHLAALGANVVLLARSDEAINAIAAEINSAETGGKALAHRGDVTQYRDVSAAVETAREAFGQLDILVNNAGLIDPISHLATSDPAAWGHIVDVNVKGVYHGLRAALPGMLERGSGTLINISSGAATGALEGWSHYCSTKAAVLSLTGCVDKEYRDAGITMVGLSPGTVATDMQTAIRESGINPVSRIDPDTHIPPDWVARAVAWLCTEKGVAYAGGDFSLKTNEGRAAVGLPLL